MATDCNKAYRHSTIVVTTAIAISHHSQMPPPMLSPITIPAIRQTTRRNNGTSPNRLFFISFNVNVGKDTNFSLNNRII